MFDDRRAAWGALPPTSKPAPVSPATRTEFMVHYDGAAPVVVKTHADCLARVKADQLFHMNGRGWSDIGYNGLVCQHGRAIEGRGIDVAGAHCTDHNRPAYGWQFMVGGTQAPTDAAKTRMARVRAECVKRSGHTLRVMGHRDGLATACPGDIVTAWLRAGMPAPTTQQEDDNMPTPQEYAKAVWDYQLPVVDNDHTASASSQLGKAHIFAYRAAGAALTAEELAAAITAAAIDLPDVDVEALAAAVVLELGRQAAT